MSEKNNTEEIHEAEPEEVLEEPVESEPSEAEVSAAEPTPEPEPDPLEHRLLRLQADFDNYRKRMVRERQEWAQRAAEDLVNDLLPALDHYEMGLATAKEHNAQESVLNGFQLVYDQLLSTLKKSGLEAIDAEGSFFDPHLHEAITYLPSADHDADLIISQTRRGYKLGSKLLRPSQVVVSSGPPEAESDAEEGDA